MARSGKLRPALDRLQGRNFKLEKQRKQEKAAQKRKAKSNPESEDEEAEDDEVEVSNEAKELVEGQQAGSGAEWETEDEDEDEEESGLGLDLSRLEDSDSDDLEEDIEDNLPNGKGVSGATADEDDVAEDEDDEDDIPLSDLSSVASEEKGDLIPHQRLTINNTTALLSALKRISLPTSTMPFSEHQSLTTADPVSIPDIEDDLNRELAFYQQSLNAVKEARILLKKEGVPFSRPTDYFAEMVKSDEHMGRVKQKLVDAAASKKAASEARKQRDLKKFGKAVQVEKQRERDRQKRETLEKINSLKRKRTGADLTNTNEEDLFDVALEDAATTERADKVARRQKRDTGGRTNFKRQKKDEKYGFGGKKRYQKSGDAISSADMRGFSTKRMKSDTFAGGKVKGAKRPGKSKRAKMR